MAKTTRRLWLWTGLILLAATRTSSLVASENPSRALNGYMLRRAEAGFNGAVLVARGSEVLLRDGYGLADAELGVRNTPETLFRIGSVSKPLVAAAVLRLVSRDRLSLDDPISKYIPQIPAKWRPVKIIDLLSHTSGIPDLFGEVDSGPPGKLRELINPTLERFKTSSLRSEPGTKYSYSNFGYLLLACVLEVADRRPWLEIMQREVFSPAGLGRTRYDDVWEIVPSRARGYERKGGVLLNTEYKDHGALAAGGFLSTVDDLSRFVSVLNGDSLLSADLRHLMFTPVQGNYGLGWQVTRFFDRPVINHTGGIGGFSAHIAYYPGEPLFLAVLSNVEDEPVKAIACDLASLALGTGSTVLDRRLAAGSDISWYGLVTGSYVGEDGEVRTISRQGDGLAYQTASVSYRLVPIETRMFTLEGHPDVTLRFGGPSEEPATSLTAQTCGAPLFTATARR